MDDSAVAADCSEPQLGFLETELAERGIRTPDRAFDPITV